MSRAIVFALVVLATAFMLSGDRPASAMPLHPDLVTKLRAEGKLASMQALADVTRQMGVNNLGENKVYHLAPGKPLTTTTRQAIVLLVDFSDNVADQVSYPPAHYTDLLFSMGTYPTGSMRDYYLENSYGNFEVTGQVTDWLRMPQTYAYYVDGQRGIYGTYPNNCQRMVEDAVAAADPGVDFSQYDNDGPDGIPDSGDDDGYVDALFVVHAGPGYESTLDDNDIHSHAWWTSFDVAVDGVNVSSYSTEPDDGSIGVFCHEFGHVLGLPDLYDYDYDSEGSGKWSVMASGSWGNGGITPTHFDAWSKDQLGFLIPVTPTGTLIDIEILRAEDNPVAYKVWTSGSPANEYFMFEYRQQTLFDSYLPGGGIVIYHVDEDMWDNDSQRCGSGSPHYMVAVEQADGECDLENNSNQGDAGDPWPGTGGVQNPNYAFNFTSTPNTRDYADAATEVSICNIRLEGIQAYATVAVDPDEDVTGPQFSAFFPTLGTSGTPFKISCDITDPSGIYDDGTGSNGQGVHLLWDNDGELVVDANEALMSWKSANTYETDNFIAGQTEGVPFVYQIAAYDNDFDDGNPCDRTQRKSGVKSIQIGAPQIGLLTIEIVPVYPSGYPFKVGENAEFHFYVRDPADGNALIDTDFQSLWWSPVGTYVSPIYHLGTGHYHFPSPNSYILGTALYTWTFTVEKAGYGLSSAAFSQAVGDVQGYDPVQIQALTVDPNDFWPGFQNVSVIYSVSKSCVGDLRVMHLPDSLLVRNLLTDYSFPAGTDTILWDGRDEGGAYVAWDDMFYLDLDVRALESWTNLGIFGPELKNPTGMKFRNNGWVYITDSYYPTRCGVTVYDENRSFRKHIGTCGIDPGQFTLIQDIAFDDAGVYYYVYDPWDNYNGRIQKFTVSSDALVASWLYYNANMPAALAFGAPGGLYLGGYGGVWRIDQSNGAATLVVDLSSGAATTVATLTPGHVCGLAVDGKGRIYCGLLNSNDIRVYSSSGQFLTSFTFINDGHDWGLDIRSGRWLYVRARLSIQVYDTEDLAAGPIESFNSYDDADMGIAVNTVGNVVTAVYDNYEVQWFRDLSSFALQRVAFTSADSGDVAGVGASNLGREPILGMPIPQPARGSLEVIYSLGVAGPARLVLYDVAGREISRLVDGNAGAGAASLRIHLVDADGHGLPSGIYFLRLEAQGRALTRKVILVK